MYTFPETIHNRSHRHVMTGLIMFSVVVFIYALSDAIISYLAPNIIENLVNNSLLMGIIFSFSSVVGFVCDYVFSNLFKEKNFFTYSLAGILIAVLFPLILLIKVNVLLILVTMAIWGIYYELVLFSKSNYVHHHLPHEKHDVGWAYLNAFSSLAYIIGPSLAVTLSLVYPQLPLYITIVLQGIALIGILVYRWVYRKHMVNPVTTILPSVGLLKGFSSWRILNKKLWPIMLFMFCLVLLDSTFWTIGAILVDQLKDTHKLASLLYVAYLLPALIITPVGIKVSQYIGKKRTAFVSGFLASLIFALTYFIADFTGFLVCVALGSILIAVATPEIHGAVEDYCERLGDHANSLVGLTGSMGSLAYVIGPIISGGIASVVGNMKTFGIIGMILCAVSLLSLIVVPRKIRLPQRELKTVFDLVSG